MLSMPYTMLRLWCSLTSAAAIDEASDCKWNWALRAAERAGRSDAAITDNGFKSITQLPSPAFVRSALRLIGVSIATRYVKRSRQLNNAISCIGCLKTGTGDRRSMPGAAVLNPPDRIEAGCGIAIQRKVASQMLSRAGIGVHELLDLLYIGSAAPTL
jgi:hypothetical protein